MDLMQTPRLFIAKNVMEYLTRWAPDYISEILLESRLLLLWEAELGFILEIQTKTRNQLQILLQTESVTATLKSITQLFRPALNARRSGTRYPRRRLSQLL